MANRILADAIVVLHFAWIVFMLLGFALTVRAFWHPAFFDRWLFRSIHLGGILFVGALGPLGELCPLTTWENALRRTHDPAATYPGSFIAHYLERLIYPNIDPLFITIPTIAIALFTLAVFVVRPPAKFRRRRTD